MRCFVYCAAFFVCALPALGGAIGLNFVNLCNSVTIPVCTTLASQATTLNYSNTLSFTGPHGTKSITVTGFADEDLNTLALKASASYSEPSAVTPYIEYASVAQLSDTFTISAPTLNGTVGFLEIPFSFTGTVSPLGLGGISVFLADSVAGTSALCQQSITPCEFAGDAVVVTGSPATGLLSFHYGSPFLLTWQMAAILHPASGFTTGSSDYSHTGVLEGFEVFDSNQQQVFNATIVPSGGEQVALLTPEPSLTVPLVVCFVLMGLAKRSGRF
jgi:hypothetical protein